MSLDRINIGNEINLNFVESDKFKTNHIGINIITRLENDLKASKNALLAKVLMRGSKNYPTMADINKRLNYLYAARIGVGAYKTGEAQIVSFSADILENRYALDDTNILDETIDILGDIFTNPLIETENGGFKYDYVEGEKINLINDIHAQINNKNAYAYQRCIEIMCKGERFSINNPGTADSVKLLDSKNLYEHYNYILESCAIEIFCVGKFADKKQFIVDKFKELLKNIKRKDSKDMENFETEVIFKSDFKGETIEEMEVNQGKLSIGFRMGTSNTAQDFINFVLFNALYGASPTSKLFDNVREKLSLCYYCYTAVEGSKGTMTVLSGVEVENKQKAEDEILKQLEEVKNGNFTDKEIEDARLSVINSYKGVFDNAGSIQHWYMARLLCGKIKTPEEMIGEIKKVTREDIINAAKKITLDTIYFLKGNLLNNGNESEDESE
ncbi:MAG: insulinase family protein [Oscillospiraceae bacterium]|nr:insulinase family protein [Oscillospiraceae bacterium]